MRTTGNQRSSPKLLVTTATYVDIKSLSITLTPGHRRRHNHQRVFPNIIPNAARDNGVLLLRDEIELERGGRGGEGQEGGGVLEKPHGCLDLVMNEAPITRKETVCPSASSGSGGRHTSATGTRATGDRAIR